MTESVTVPAANPKSSYLANKEEIDRSICSVLESGQYILGKQVEEFERRFAEYVGVRHVVAVGSGTDALALSLKACGLKAGDGVFTVSHTAVATVAAIEQAGGIPVLVDVVPDTFTLDPARLEEAIAKIYRSSDKAIRPFAVLPVHLYGHPADMDAIRKLAARYELHVIEDCAQAHGAALHGSKAGSWGTMAAFSFYPTKNLGAFGDAGAVATDDDELATQARLLRQYGWRKRNLSEKPGFNSRMDEIQASVLLAKLQRLDQDNARRNELARRYDDRLSGLGLVLPHCKEGAAHVYHQYVIQTDSRDELRAYLAKRGVQTLIHYPLPVHLQPAYLGRTIIGDGGLEVTERICRKIVSLPMYPQLTEQQIGCVCEGIVDWRSCAGTRK